MPIIPTNLLYDFAAEAAPVAQAYLVNEAPKAALQTAARGFAIAHHLGPGAISGLVGAAIMGAWRATGRATRSTNNLRGRSRAAPKVRPMEKAPRLRLGGAETSSASGKKNLRKTGRRSETTASGLEIVERPLKLSTNAKGDRPKSVWSSLRDLVSGKKVLKNSFSFKMTSDTDKRGLMAIPLRHDGCVKNGDANWTVGSQVANAVTAANGFGAYTTMLQEPPQQTYSTDPALGVNNIIIPQLNLPSLEQTSWDLNCLKLTPVSNGEVTKTNNSAHSIAMPVMQLGGSDVQVNANGTSVYGKGFPAARNSFARMQTISAEPPFPYDGLKHQLPRFMTQLGPGSLRMRMCNQSTNKATVEFVVLKVVNPYMGKYDRTDGIEAGYKTNMTKLWANIYRTVGSEYRKKTLRNLSYKMGDVGPTPVELELDVINNPYKPWLPDSCFKSTYDADEGNRHAAGNVAHVTGNTNNISYEYTSTGAAPGDPNATVGSSYTPYGGLGGVGQKTPYRVFARGHATISGAAERNITIPLPSSNYDATQIDSLAAVMDTSKVVDGAEPILTSKESFIVLISVNGSIQDVIEPQLDANGASTGNIKVVGKSYTSAIVDFHCQYTETVYPSHCDYAAITPVAYNMGDVRGAQVTTRSSAAYPGKVLPMADAVPVTQAGVLRTGATDRAGDNAGSID